jgi:hypothetical protein
VMEGKMFWLFLLLGIILFVSSFIYNLEECTAFQTDWYACTILECRISRFVENFSLGILITTLSLWLAHILSKAGRHEENGKLGKGIPEQENRGD